MTGPKASDQYDDPRMPFVYLNITEQYQRITEKTIKTLMHVYEHLLSEFDWFVRANDDTYLILENLRSFLANKCPDEKVMYGKILRYYRFRNTYTNGNNTRGFVQGGTGVLFSRESVRLFGEAMKKDPTFCVMKMGQLEDQEISDCFRKLNIYPGETRDSADREQFLMDTFEQLSILNEI